MAETVDDLKCLVADEYSKAFKTPPRWVVRAPGRVNLIGEHIDYNGYGVLPMAIEQSIYVAVGRNEDQVLRFSNFDLKFNEFEWPLDVEWKGTVKPKWYEYFLSGWKGGIDWLKAQNQEHRISGINVFVHGTVPPAAGLSSSSALVCAATLSTWALYTGRLFSGYYKTDLVQVATNAERLVGMEGGGMDQATVVLAEEGMALHIDFDPLNVRKVLLPEDAVFCVLHSGVDSNKAAHSHYNDRVVECRIASQESAKLSLSECSLKSKTVLEDKMVRNDLLDLLQTSESKFETESLNQATAKKTDFVLSKRAVHVFDEAYRVVMFEAACQNGDIQRMGQLMNESHTSCKDLYDCSCKEMDELVQKCRESGALGARLTGAGWGGCAVALVKKIDLEEVGNKLEVLFWSKPCAGIEAWELL